MKIAYICHPVSGDIEGNMEKIRQIVRHINLTERRVVPFAPYIVDLQVLDDNVPAERARGIYNDYEYFNRKMIDEVRVYGDRISEGMKAEIELSRKMDIPVIYYGYPFVAKPVSAVDTNRKEQFESKIDHIGRIYETTKSGIYKKDMKAALDGLQELRNIACDALQKLYW